MIGLPLRLPEPAPFLVEIVLLALAGVLAVGAARRVLPVSNARRVPLRVAVVMLLLIGVGQAARTKLAFPLMPYTMYGRAREADVLFYRYEAQHRSGRRAPFYPSRVLSTLGNGRIAKGLHNRLEAIAKQRTSGPSTDRDWRLLERTLLVLVGMHNRHAGDPVTRVDVERVSIPPPYRPGTARSQRVASVTAEHAR